MFEAMGMNFINKGIDQFTFGVGQEYNRASQERQRSYAVQDLQYGGGWDMESKIKKGIEYGIHPLAAIGAGGGSTSQSVSGNNVPPPYGSGGHPVSNKPSPAEQRIINANARKAEAEATIAENMATESGQADAGQVGSSGLAPAGQTDGNIYMTSDVGFADRYDVDSEGYAYIRPTQSAEQAFGEEGTIMNRALYNARKIWYPEKVRELRNDWGNPKNAEFKRQFLMTRPHDPKGKFTFLWSGAQWKRVPKQFYPNPDQIFLDKKRFPIYAPYKTKRRIRGERETFSDIVSP